MSGKVNEAYRFWYTLKLTSGAPAISVAGVDQTITVRDPANSTTMSTPTVVEVSGGLYYFDISATFTNTNGSGQYGGTIEINSSSPVLVDMIPVSVEFFTINTEDLMEVRYDSPAGPAVWIDVLNGAGGAVVGVNGTSDNPVNNEADAYTLAVALGYRRYYFNAGNITLASGSSIAYQDWTFHGGAQCGVIIGGKNVWGSTFKNITISGTFDPVGNEGFDIKAIDCQVGACTDITGRFNNCAIHSTLSMPTVVIAFGVAGALSLNNCWNVNTPDFPARIDMGGANAIGSIVRVKGFKGKLLVQNMAEATAKFEGSFDGADLEFENTCTAGEAPILSGIFKLTDNSVGLTMDTLGRVGEVSDVYLGATHGIGNWVDAGLSESGVTGLFANPGQSVGISVQTLDPNGERVDGYVPQIDYVVTPAGAMQSGYPAAMTREAEGNYSLNVSIPTGLTAVGTYIVSTSWSRPGTAFTQYKIFLINVALPFGNATVSPA